MAAITTAVVVGDSFGNEFGEYPWLLSISVENYCIAGDRIIADIEPTYAADIAARLTTSTIAVIQGGVNDIINSEVIGDMQTALTSCVTIANAASMDVIVVGLSPWTGFASHTAGRQTTTDDWNTWLAAQAAVQGFTFVDIYTPLEGTADTLNAAYDSGDSLHPNAAGGALIASLIDTAMSPFITTEAATGNLVKRWRGAVEPAETGASGNEYKAWRGAVEPAAPTPSGGGTQGAGTAFGIALGFGLRPS